ncbi:MAG: LCP family protein [Chloroflexi bacterium]|nr:LCP family protein [Chloroflexota bacterium]
MIPRSASAPWNVYTALAVLTLASGCGSAPAPGAVAQAGAPNGAVVVGAPAGATFTPTAFQPLAVTATLVPTLAPTREPTSAIPTARPLATATNIPTNWVGYPGPAIYPPIAIPPPVGRFAQPDDQINILLLGSDQRPYDSGFRTDTIILVTLNAKLKTVTMTSFPRDLYVYIPGWTMERINAAFRYGGFEALALTLEYNFGVRPDHYALMNFKGFVTLIDELGEIDVEVGQTLTDHRDNKGNYTVQAGTVQMDGETALWYVRSRYTSSDFDRARRQQEVLTAIFRKIISLDGVRRAGDLYDAFDEIVQTDIGLLDVLGIAPLAAQIDPGSIQSYTIGPEYVTPWINPYNGAQVLLPNLALTTPLMREALNIR